MGLEEDISRRIIEENGLIENWARITLEYLKQNLFKYKIGVTESLKNSLKYTIVKDSQNWTQRVTFEFNLYGRFVDMGVGKGVSLGGAREVKIMRRALNQRGNGIGRKPKPWEAKGFAAQSFRLQELIAELLQQTITTEVADVLSRIPIVINSI